MMPSSAARTRSRRGILAIAARKAWAAGVIRSAGAEPPTAAPGAAVVVDFMVVAVAVVGPMAVAVAVVVAVAADDTKT